MMRSDTRILRTSVLVLALGFAAACDGTSTPTALTPSIVTPIATLTPTDITAPVPATDPTPAPTPTPSPTPPPAPSPTRLLSLVIGSSPGDLTRISDETYEVRTLDTAEAGVERVLSI